VPGTTVTRGSTVTVEAFLKSSGEDSLIWAYQIDLPCILIGASNPHGRLLAGCRE